MPSFPISPVLCTPSATVTSIRQCRAPPFGLQIHAKQVTSPHPVLCHPLPDPRPITSAPIDYLHDHRLSTASASRGLRIPLAPVPAHLQKAHAASRAAGVPYRAPRPPTFDWRRPCVLLIAVALALQLQSPSRFAGCWACSTQHAARSASSWFFLLSARKVFLMPLCSGQETRSYQCV